MLPITVRKFPNNKGFTLIEILAAVVIFTVGLLGVAGLTMVIIRGNTFSSMLTTATVLAQDKLEELRETTYAAIASGSDTAVENNVNYTRVWNITDDAPATGMKTIEVTVSWQIRGARQHQVVIKTIISNS
jgi:type IV pilus assembly protein PilV